jgi:CHAD domain-containing protein
MRYAVELSAEIAGQQTTPELRTLKRGQDLLGRLHDLQVLIDRVRQLQASLTPPDLVAWREFDALITSLENDCRRLHARYMRARPALLAVCDRDGARPPASAVRRRAG